jgi:hypothetical protein
MPNNKYSGPSEIQNTGQGRGETSDNAYCENGGVGGKKKSQRVFNPSTVRT